MKYGILGLVPRPRATVDNDGVITRSWEPQWTLLARFTVPMTVRSNEPITMSDTLSLKRFVRSRGAQRWEIEANVEPLSAGANDLFAMMVSKGYSEPFQIVVPQNIDFVRYNNDQLSPKTAYYKCIKARSNTTTPPYNNPGNWSEIGNITTTRLLFRMKASGTHKAADATTTPDTEPSFWERVYGGTRRYYQCIKATGTSRTIAPDQDHTYWKEVGKTSNTKWASKTSYAVDRIVYHDISAWNKDTTYSNGAYVYYDIPTWANNRAYKVGAYIKYSAFAEKDKILSGWSVQVKTKANAGAKQLELKNVNQRLPVGLLFQFQNHPKVYMIKSVSYNDNNAYINIYPALRKDVNADEYIWYGDFRQIAANTGGTRNSSYGTASNLDINTFWTRLNNTLVMPAYLDTDSIQGMTYQDGILMDLGTLKFVEALE